MAEVDSASGIFDVGGAMGVRKVSEPVGLANFPSVPVIDLTNLNSNDPKKISEVAKEIYRACTEVGFFYIKNHGISEKSVESIRNESNRFFHDLSDDQKMELEMKKSKDYFGYAPIRMQPEDGASGKRLYESINFGYERRFDRELSHLPLEKHYEAENYFPTDLPNFEDNVGSYLSEMLSLSRKLIRLFALSLELPGDFFDSMCDRPGVILKLNHYPGSLPDKDLDAGIHAHTDHELFTILLQDDDVNSLEVVSANGTWVPADPTPGTFVVNIGDALSMWTNDIFLSTLHRAYNKEGRSRYTVPFFFGANYDAIMETVPSCISDKRPLKYKPVSAREHLGQKMKWIYGKS